MKFIIRNGLSTILKVLLYFFFKEKLAHVTENNKRIKNTNKKQTIKPLNSWNNDILGSRKAAKSLKPNENTTKLFIVAFTLQMSNIKVCRTLRWLYTR